MKISHHSLSFSTLFLSPLSYFAHSFQLKSDSTDFEKLYLGKNTTNSFPILPVFRKMSIILFNKIIKKILRNFIKILPTNYHFPSEKTMIFRFLMILSI